MNDRKKSNRKKPQYFGKYVIEQHDRFQETKDTSIVIPSVYKFRLFDSGGRHQIMNVIHITQDGALARAKQLSNHDRWRVKFSVRFNQPMVMARARAGDLNHIEKW